MSPTRVRSTLIATFESLENRRLFAVNPVVVDVAVFYTAGARNSVGGVENLSRRLDRAVADTNFMLANSKIDATVRVVWFGETDYKESLDLSTDLSRLQNPADGQLDPIHARRNSTGADLVHLLVADGDDGGRAYQLDDPSKSWPDFGFAVSQARFANLEYIFAHETMHNLGAGHDDQDTSSRRLPYAYGLAIKTGSQTVHTLMGPGTRIPYLSSQDLTWRGQILGAAQNSARSVQFGHAADNARAVREFAPKVAANRVTKISDATVPVARQVQRWVDASGKTLHVQIALVDDTAINLATLDGNDLRVTGPNGFSRLATFAGVDRNTNGAQRLARYTVDITGRSTDASLYTPALVGGQVADLAGHTVAAGTLGSSYPVRFADRAGPNLHTALELGTIDRSYRLLVDSINDLDNSNFYRFTLSASAKVTAKVNGLSANASLFLVQDANNNGTIESQELLSSSSNLGTTAEQVQRSLPAGTYAIWVAPVAGDVTTYSLSLSAAAAAGGLPPSPPSGQPPAQTSSVQGVIWRDNNGNGIRDGWEVGLAGWDVYADVNSNGAFDTGDVRATTDATGAYVISGLAPRGYIVRSIDQAGYRRTTSPSLTLTLQAGQTATAKNFGHTPRALVGGVVFTDLNRNGIRDGGEAGASGWQVYLDKNANSILDAGEFQATTDANGNWSIKDAWAGTYVVKLVGKAGYAATPAGGIKLALKAGEVIVGKNLGVRKV